MNQNKKIEQIARLIVQEAISRKGKDLVDAIYAVCMEVDLSVMETMRRIRGQEAME